MSDTQSGGTVRCADYVVTMQSVDDGAAQLVLTDPPYGIGYLNPYTHIEHDRIEGDDGSFSYGKLADEAFRVLDPDGCFMAFTGWSEYPDHFNDAKDAGFKMREPLICQKRPSGSTGLYNSFQTNADWLLFAHKGKFRFRPTELLRNKRAGSIPNIGRKPVPEYKTRFPSCWFGPDYPWASENSSYQRVHNLEHPTIKGQKFLEWVIQMTTDEGALVVDPFVGSGTVAAACKATGRRYVVGDIKPAYASMTERRLAAQSGRIVEEQKNG